MQKCLWLGQQQVPYFRSLLESFLLPKLPSKGQRPWTDQTQVYLPKEVSYLQEGVLGYFVIYSAGFSFFDFLICPQKFPKTKPHPKQASSSPTPPSRRGQHRETK